VANLNAYTGTLINTGSGSGAVIVSAAITNAASLLQDGASTMILAKTNTYTGLTMITNGILALTNSASISNTPAIVVYPGATLDVSGLTNGPYNLVNGQTLQAAGGTVNGNLDLQSSATLGVNYAAAPALAITGGALNLNENPVTITVSGSALPVGSYQLISVGAGGSVAGAVDSSVVTINGAGAAGTGTLQIAGDGLYLVVASGGGSGPGQPQGISVAAGQVTIAFAGIAGDSYGVQRSTNLVNWTTIWSTNAPAGGVFGFTDPFSDLGGTPPPAAYYRLTW
jgi:autotransporter-associated beta strand protein